MKYRFFSLNQVENSPLFDFTQMSAQRWQTDRLTRSTRFENKVYQDELRQDRRMAAAGAALRQKLSASETLIHDIFQALYSLHVQETSREERTLRAQYLYAPILGCLRQSENWQELKHLCEGQSLIAAQATRSFCHQLAEHLDSFLSPITRDKDWFAVLEQLNRRKTAFQTQLKNALIEDENIQPEQKDVDSICKLAQKTASLQEQVMHVEKIIQSCANTAQLTMQASLQQTAAAALQAAQDSQDMISSFGTQAGSGANMSANRKLIAEIEKQPELKEISRQLGRMKEILSSLRKNSFCYNYGEKFNLTRGHDLKNVLTSEFSLLAAPETTPMFLKRYAAKNLQQYARRDAIRKGKGDIIVCVDESISMRGENAIWSKAIALALQDICAYNGRKFALVHFSGGTEIKSDLFLPKQYTHQNLLDAAQHFFGGGTNFEAPLQEALRLIKESSFCKADIVFTTDGQCCLPQAFAENLCAQKQGLCLTIQGILVGDAQDKASSLEQVCDKICRYKPDISEFLS